MWNIGDSVLWFTGQNVHFGHIRWIRGGDEVVGVYFTEDVGDNPGVLGSIENGAVKLVKGEQLKLVSKAPEGGAQPGQSVLPPTYGATAEDYGTSGPYTEAVFTRKSYQQPTKTNFPRKEVSHSSNEDSSVDLKKRVTNEDKALSETIQFLIKRDGSASLDSLSRKLEYQPDAFHRFLKKKHQVFKLEKKDDAIDVKLNVELCQDYWTTSGCVSVKCNRFHICRNFVLGTCNEKTNRCLFGHKFNTKQNLKARNAHGLEHVDENEIEQLVCNMEGLVQAPLVCLDYNSGDCQKIDSKCKSLHICVRLVMGTCSDENACSVRNHDIRKKECIAILEKRGIETNQSPKELFTIIKQKINNSADLKAFTSGTSKSSRSNVGQGDVNNEICCDFVSGKCSRGCSMMHSKKIFQWQIRHPINHAWLNLQPFHSNNIEAHFRIPSLDSYIIDVMDSKKVESEGKPIFEVLGTQRWEALFRGSGFCLLNRSGEGNYTHLNLRRLATRSHTASDSPHATVWGWYFVDKSRKCLLYGSQGADKDSSNIDSVKLEKAYAKDPTSKINFATMSFNYEIDFKSMTQQNLSTKNKRDVIRRPLGSDEEVKKAQQHAARSSSTSPSPPRKSSLPTQSSLLPFRDLPKNWDPMPPGNQCILVKLPAGSQEYNEIQQFFLSSLGRTPNIQSIERIQNPYVRQQFEDRKKYFAKIFPNKAQQLDRRLFHGTKSQNVDAISQQNFDWRLHGTSSGHSHGKGVYFASSASTSDGYASGNKTLFIARVIVINVIQGNNNMLIPPPLPSNPNILYDTSVDNQGSPSVFIKYNDQDMCPEYLLRYT